MAFVESLVANKRRFLASARKDSPDASDGELEELYETAREFLSLPGARIEMDATTLLKDALQMMPAIEDVLADRCWLLGMAPDDAPIVTSDDPVVMQWDGPGEPPMTWNPGHGDPNTVVMVALGPRHILAGVSRTVRGNRRPRLSRADVAAFNTAVALRAERFVYFSGSTFVFEQDGAVIDDGSVDWLKRTKNETRGGMKRGAVHVVKAMRSDGDRARTTPRK